jgi:DedD protein
MKEKFDLSLDNRQVVSLLIGALVVLGTVFVLGVVVGKKLAVSHEAAQAPDLLTALDAQAAAHARAQEEETPDLTFPDELTRKTPAPPRAGEPAPKPAVVTIALPVPAPAAEPATGPAAAPAESEAAVAAAPEDAPEPVAVQPAKTLPRKEERPVVAEAPRTPKPKPAPEAPKKAVVPAPVVTRTVPASGSRPETKASVPTGTAANGGFTLQVSASQSREEADRFVKRLRERGYAPYVVTAEVLGKGTWFRVRMGRFADKEGAARYLADFKRETRMDAFIAPAD